MTVIANGPGRAPGAVPGSQAARAGASAALAARAGNGLARWKPAIGELGIDLAALRWHRSGPGAGSFEVAFVGMAQGPRAAGGLGGAPNSNSSSLKGAPEASGESAGAQPGAGARRAGYPTDASAEWVLLRVAGDPAARVLIYDRVEWESFVDGAARGEFDDAVGPGSSSADP